MAYTRRMLRACRVPRLLSLQGVINGYEPFERGGLRPTAASPVTPSVQIMADAAVEILGRPAGTDTGRTVLDVEILREAGISDFSQYGGRSPLAIDIFVDAPIP